MEISQHAVLRDKVALRITGSKCQIYEYQNKDRLSVCMLLTLQRKPYWVAQNLRLGRMRPEDWS